MYLPAVENQRFYGIAIKIGATSKLGDLLAAISERDCGKGSSIKQLLKFKEADMLQHLFIFVIY